MFVGTDLTRLPHRDLGAAVSRALTLLGFNEFNHVVVGNHDSAYLNDLDIAIGRNQLASHLELAGDGCLWTALEAYLKERPIGEFTIQSRFRQFHFATPMSGMCAAPIFVKTDVFIGEIGWMKALVSGAPIDSKYKAIYRNMLLMSVFLEVCWPAGEGDGDEFFRYALNYRDGLSARRFRRVHASQQDGRPKRMMIQEARVTSDPNDLPLILFDGGGDWTDIDSFEKLHHLLQGSRFRYGSFLPAIFQNFRASLQKRNMRLPDIA